VKPTHSPDDATDVQALMRHTAEGYANDTDRVVREAARRGRRHKRTRAAAAAGLGVAAVALLTTIAVYGVSSAGELATPAVDPTGPATSATTAPATATPTTTSPSPTRTTARERTFAFAPELLADELAEAVATRTPGSRTSDHTTWSEDIAVTDAGDMQARLDKDDPFEGASIVLDDGQGASQVTLLIADNDGIGLVGPNPTCGTLPDGTPPGTTCQDLDDGSILLERARATEARPEGTVVSNTVTVMTADGWMIEATSRNSPAEKNATITRTQPALVVADLARLVLEPDWLADTH
jgi:hypothetical protein